MGANAQFPVFGQQTLVVLYFHIHTFSVRVSKRSDQYTPSIHARWLPDQVHDTRERAARVMQQSASPSTQYSPRALVRKVRCPLLFRDVPLLLATSSPPPPSRSAARAGVIPGPLPVAVCHSRPHGYCALCKRARTCALALCAPALRYFPFLLLPS